MNRPVRSGASETFPWGRLEPVADGAWALVSTPLSDHEDARRTLCNGGIIAGEEGLMLVEGFMSTEGAAWLADQARHRTGMEPTHIVLTHFHVDHTSGTAGYLRGGNSPQVMATATTRRLLAEREAELAADERDARLLVLPDTLVPDGAEPVEVDLGGRLVRLVVRSGHTPSDMVIELDDASVIWTGDLVWNGMFPNYMDALPEQLSASVRELRDQEAALYVSGHGELADRSDLDRCIDLLDHIEDAARRAKDRGFTAEEAASEFEVPSSLGEWPMLSESYPEKAMSAWFQQMES